MAIRTENKVIGDSTYRARQLPAGEGRRAFARLVRFLGPALAGLTSGEKDKGANLGATLAGLASALTPEDVDYFCDTFGAVNDVKNGDDWPRVSAVFDIHFAGKYGEMMKWIAWNIELNFGSFFADLGLRLSAPQGQSE